MPKTAPPKSTPSQTSQYFEFLNIFDTTLRSKLKSFIANYNISLHTMASHLQDYTLWSGKYGHGGEESKDLSMDPTYQVSLTVEQGMLK